MYKAMYNYKAQGNSDVSFHQGYLIEQIEVMDNGWWIGKFMQTGERRKFSELVTYLKLLCFNNY